MRIIEIIAEDEYEKGKSFATKLLSPSKWIASSSTGEYEKRKSAGAKILSPSQWFKSNKSSDEPTDTKVEKPIEKSATVNLDNVKHILNSVVRGEPRYFDDINILNQLRTKIKNGSISVSGDATAIARTLKSIINNDKLTTDQIKTIKDYADSI